MLWPYVDELSPRRTLRLIRHLPLDSAFVGETQGGAQHRAWSIDTYLLAAVADQLAAANWQRGGGKGKKPKPIKRPQRKAAQSAGGRSLASTMPRFPPRKP